MHVSGERVFRVGRTCRSPRKDGGQPACLRSSEEAGMEKGMWLEMWLRAWGHPAVLADVDPRLVELKRHCRVLAEEPSPKPDPLLDSPLSHRWVGLLFPLL